MAHVGLLPDLLADLEILGIPQRDLEPLFNSAEGYVEVWERAENQNVHQLVWDGQHWINQDLTTASGVETLTTPAAALVSFSKADGSQHVYYTGKDHHVYQLVCGGQHWVNQDLTAASGIETLTANRTTLTSFIKDQTTEHVYYSGIDLHAHQLIWDGSHWINQDLSVASGIASLVQSTAGLNSFTQPNQTEHLYYLSPVEQ